MTLTKNQMIEIRRAAYRAAGMAFDDSDYNGGSSLQASGGSSGPGNLAAAVNMPGADDPDNSGSSGSAGGGGSSGRGMDSDFDLGLEVESFLTGKISPEDMEVLTKIFLQGAGASVEDLPNPNAMASDAAIMAKRRRLIAAGKMAADQLYRPIHRPRSPADERRFSKMFPHANRLG